MSTAGTNWLIKQIHSMHKVITFPNPEQAQGDSRKEQLHLNNKANKPNKSSRLWITQGWAYFLLGKQKEVIVFV